MLKIENKTKGMITLPNKVVLAQGITFVTEKVWEEAQKHPVVAQMIKDKKIAMAGKHEQKGPAAGDSKPPADEPPKDPETTEGGGEGDDGEGEGAGDGEGAGEGQ